MGNYIDRMMTESAELADKLNKLSDFMFTELFKSLPSDDRDLLSAQHKAMSDYHEILMERLRRAEP